VGGGGGVGTAESVTLIARPRFRVTFPLAIEVNVTHLHGIGFGVTYSSAPFPRREIPA
jgi:hypothetical protein